MVRRRKQTFIELGMDCATNDSSTNFPMNRVLDLSTKWFQHVEVCRWCAGRVDQGDLGDLDVLSRIVCVLHAGVLGDRILQISRNYRLGQTVHHQLAVSNK